MKTPAQFLWDASSSFALAASVVGVSALVAFTGPATAAGFDSRAREAVRAGSLGEMQRVVRDAGKAIRDDANPSAALLEDVIAALGRVDRGVDTLRDKRESAVENDEAALEALYESDTWLRLDHLQGELQYWRGWAHFRNGTRKESAGQDGVAEYRAARRDFGRAMRNIREPAVARETLLATAIAERGAGSAGKSATTLKRIERLFEDSPAEFKTRLRLEQARSAAALGQPRQVIALTENSKLGSAVGRDLFDLRLETLLAEPLQRPELIRATAKPMLQAGGDAAARAVVALENAKLSSAEIARFKLGPEGRALEGLALLREERFAEAADKLGSVAGGSLAGLREDVVLARLAEAQLQARRGAAAYATSRRVRSSYPDTSLRGQVARYGYAAAQLWLAEEEGSASAQQAVESASAWVLSDAPKSEEAAEVRVQRAMARAQRSSPDRALRTLERLPQGGPGSVAVSLQKALLRSVKVQTALEAALRRTASARRHAEELDRLLRQVPSDGALAQEHTTEIAIARARARLGLGHAGALAPLTGLPQSLDVERTRIVGLWLQGDTRGALLAAVALLERGPGSSRDRFRWTLPVALAASEQSRADPVALRTLLRAVRERAPAEFDREFLMEIALREALAAQRAGANGEGLALTREILSEAPTTLSNLTLIAELFEAGGEPGPATEVWHQISEVSDRGGDAWLRARVGVARSLRATPGRAQDGCDVATSLVVSGRSLPAEVADELRNIARSCEEVSAYPQPGVGSI